MKYENYIEHIKQNGFFAGNLEMGTECIHNHNIHSSTRFRPLDIINNTNEDIMKQVLDNIEKSIKKFR